MSRKRRNDIYLLSSYSFLGNSFIDWMKGFEDPVINHSGFGRMYIFFFTHVHVEWNQIFWSQDTQIFTRNFNISSPGSYWNAQIGTLTPPWEWKDLYCIRIAACLFPKMFFKFQIFWERSNQILEVLSKNLVCFRFWKRDSCGIWILSGDAWPVAFETEFGANLELRGVTKQSLNRAWFGATLGPRVSISRSKRGEIECWGFYFGWWNKDFSPKKGAITTGYMGVYRNHNLSITSMKKHHFSKIEDLSLLVDP